jgi:hypothetical protein
VSPKRKVEAQPPEKPPAVKKAAGKRVRTLPCIHRVPPESHCARCDP